MGRDLEINRMSLENSIPELNDLDVKVHNEIVKPIKKKDAPSFSEMTSSRTWIEKILFVLLVIDGVIGGLDIAFLLLLLMGRTGANEFDESIRFLLICLVVIVVIGVVLLLLRFSTHSILKYTLGKKKFNKAVEEYNKYSKEIDSTNEAQVKKYDEQKEIIDERVNVISNNLNDVNKILEQYYDLNIIYPKYRNIVAITTFIEYLESGRCDSLYGFAGCYSLYEQELKQNIIIGKIDLILNELEQIKQAQLSTYLAIEESSRLQTSLVQTCTDMLDETKRTNATLEAQAEDTKIIKRNSEISTYIAKIDYRKNLYN